MDHHSNRKGEKHLEREEQMTDKNAISGKKASYKKYILRGTWLLYAICSIIITFRLADSLLIANYSATSRNFSLHDHWDIMINDASYRDVKLDDFQFDPVGIGDEVVMQKDLPDDWDIAQGALRLRIRHTAVRMYIDDELVYEYGNDRIEKKKSVGSGYQFVNFPDSYKGKHLRIHFYVSEDNAFTKLDPLPIYEWENIYRVLLTQNRLPLFIGSFLVIFGFAVLILTMFAVLFSTKYVRIFCIAFFSVCVGLWTLCNYNVVLIFSIPLYSKSLMEYLSLFICPIPLCIYMYENVNNLGNKVLKGVYWVLFTIQVAFDLVAIGLHSFDIIHCAVTLKYLQILIICHILFFAIVIVLNMKTKQLINRLYLYGVLVIVACVGYDLLDYFLERYNGHSIASVKGLSALGMMLFVFIMFIEFYMNMAQKMMQETERNLLIKSAYTDELTQLHNRRFCSEHMKEISAEQSADYTVVCFDLNNLKVMNDTYGHAKGDILIRSAADVIGGTFQRHGIVGRMGGDEFIAIMKNMKKTEIETLIEKFRANIAKKNQEIAGLDMSIAYGYASGFEMDDYMIEKIYQKADDRMYENKQQYKLQHPNSKGRK